jgi:hypothetical protein
LLLTNGECFEGMFVEDDINGPGRFTDIDNCTLRGHWEGNLLVKEL